MNSKIYRRIVSTVILLITVFLISTNSQQPTKPQSIGQPPPQSPVPSNPLQVLQSTQSARPVQTIQPNPNLRIQPPKLNTCGRDICQNNQPEDCLALHQCGYRQNGVYKIYPPGTAGFQVTCDMQTDGGGWTLFQRRYDGKLNFFRGWRDFQFGFGRIDGEHYLGNERLHEMTSRGFHELRIDMEDWNKRWRYAKYRLFSVESVNTRYKLNIDGYVGNAGDALMLHDGMGFYTKDADTPDKCAQKYKGAWWYKSCHYSNLNGHYYQGGNTTTFGDGLVWYHWNGYKYSLKTTEMKFRRR